MKNTENLDIKNEIWKDVKGYKGYYQVSNLGRVRSLERYINVDSIAKQKHKRYCKGQILKQHDNGNGYLFVMLCKNNKKKKKFYVHRLVAQAFLKNPEKKPQVNHINGKKADNRLINLEYVTAQENHLHAIDNQLRDVKIPEKTAKFMRDRYDEDDIRYTIKALAKRFKITESYVKAIVTGKARNNAV